jgi:acylphosphatase
MTTTTRRRVHVLVSGVVQGVWFRRDTQAEAARLGLAGWVRNLPDRRVELLAEGAPADVEQLLHWARRGPPDARVDALEVEELPPEGTNGRFEIQR